MLNSKILNSALYKCKWPPRHFQDAFTQAISQDVTAKYGYGACFGGSVPMLKKNGEEQSEQLFSAVHSWSNRPKCILKPSLNRAFATLYTCREIIFCCCIDIS